MSRALTLPPQPGETKWTVVRGSLAGTVRLMTSGNFTIGRSPECEFIISNDPKCSRRHATVGWTSAGFEIVGLVDGNPILVNGKDAERHILKNGDIVTIGTTEIQFGTVSHPSAENVQLRRLNSVPSQTNTFKTNGVGPRRPRSSSGRSRSPLTYIYIALGAFILFMMFSGKPNKKKQLQIRGEEQIQEAIENAQKLQESGEKLNSRRYNDNAMSRQAQEHYVRGFRDFRKGQFERALDSFNTCLALNPAHTLCNRYKLLGQRKFNELVQLQIVVGRRHRDQNQFKSCQAAFRNVMVMVKDANSAAYREAKANYDACHTMSEGRF